MIYVSCVCSEVRVSVACVGGRKRDFTTTCAACLPVCVHGCGCACECDRKK